MTNRNSAQKNFAPGTSRGTRRATTLLAQVADLERGDRIKQLREGRHLTQPVVAERVGVTLRGYQEWEAGGGIQWENAKRLAKVLGSNPDYVMSGERAETPDLSHSQLDRIEADLADLKKLIEAFRVEAGANAVEVTTQLSSMQRREARPRSRQQQ